MKNQLMVQIFRNCIPRMKTVYANGNNGNDNSNNWC